MNGEWEEWIDELVEVAERVFELAGVTDKLERGFALVVLGFLFNTQSGVLQIPSEKCKEILALL
eukprot:2082975-Rhodomonas_salina.1